MNIEMNQKTPGTAVQQTADSSSDSYQLVTFKLINETFGLPILDVREIIRMTDITPVPHAPSFVEGVINLRGQIIPVIDLRKRFNLAAHENDGDTRIVVVEINANAVVGLIVDSVREVQRIPKNTINPAPAIVAKGIGSEYLDGISHHNKQMTILINIRRVFKDSEIEGLGDLG